MSSDRSSCASTRGSISSATWTQPSADGSSENTYTGNDQDSCSSSNGPDMWSCRSTGSRRSSSTGSQRSALTEVAPSLGESKVPEVVSWLSEMAGKSSSYRSTLLSTSSSSGLLTWRSMSPDLSTRRLINGSSKNTSSWLADMAGENSSYRLTHSSTSSSSDPLTWPSMSPDLTTRRLTNGSSKNTSSLLADMADKGSSYRSTQRTSTQRRASSSSGPLTRNSSGPLMVDESGSDIMMRTELSRARGEELRSSSRRSFLEVDVLSLQYSPRCSEQAPYVRLQYGSQIHITRTGEGANPTFVDHWTISLSQKKTELKIEVFNSNSNTRNSYIGWGRISLGSVLQESYTSRNVVLYSERGSYAGEVNLKLRYIPATSKRQLEVENGAFKDGYWPGGLSQDAYTGYNQNYFHSHGTYTATGQLTYPCAYSTYEAVDQYAYLNAEQHQGSSTGNNQNYFLSHDTHTTTGQLTDGSYPCGYSNYEAVNQNSPDTGASLGDTSPLANASSGCIPNYIDQYAYLNTEQHQGSLTGSQRSFQNVEIPFGRLQCSQGCSEQAPSFRVQYGSKIYLTRTGEGKNPIFVDHFVITSSKKKTELQIQVFKSNSNTLDSYIGGGHISLGNVLQNRFDSTTLKICSENGRYVGELKVKLQYAYANWPENSKLEIQFENDSSEDYASESYYDAKDCFEEECTEN